MPPINIIVVQTILLPKERQNIEALSQAQKLLSKALTPVNQNLKNKEYLIGDFSGVDIMLGHALYMSNKLGAVSSDMTEIKNYIKRLESRPSFIKAIET